MTDRPIWPGEDDSTGLWAVRPDRSTVADDDAAGPALGPAGEPVPSRPIWPGATNSPTGGSHTPPGRQAAGPLGPPLYGPPPYGPPPYGPPPYGPPPYGPPPYGPGPSGEPPAGAQSRASRRGPVVRSAAAVLVIAAAAVAGAGISHAAWPARVSTNAVAPLSTTPTTNAGAGGTVPAFGSSPNSGSTPFSSGNGTGGSGSGTTEGAGAPSDVSAIAAKVDQAIVDINVTLNYQDAQGAGTGIVLTSTGEVLTNNHVVDGATKISVTDVGNGKTYPATVVGYSLTRDIAVLQLQGASGLKTAQLATSSPSIGEAVVAIGNAGGTGGTPTSAGGSITALGQSITASDQLTGSSEQLSGLIQVNANVEAGDSGGPLVNAAGQVIGMDTAASQGFNFSAQGNAGFAIPIRAAIPIANEIEAGQASATIHIGSTAFLGVLVGSSADNPFYGQFSGGTGAGATGVAVSNVVSGGPAQLAGIGPGDTIVSLGGHAVTSPSQLTRLLIPHHPGQKVKVVWQDTTGQSHTAMVTLASGPAS